jgi:hypothetical protein
MNARDRPSNPSLNTLDALQNVDEWKLSDLKTQINLTRQLLEKMKGLQKDGESIKSHMSKLDREAVKSKAIPQLITCLFSDTHNVRPRCP